MDITKKQQLESIITIICKLSGKVAPGIIMALKHCEEFRNPSDAVDALMIELYKALQSEQEILDFSFELLRHFNPSSYKDINEMKNVINNREVLSIGENHTFIKKTITSLCSKFYAKGIDYYLTGSLPYFLALNIDLFRYHNDIDIMINEDDIFRVAEIFEETDYSFEDKRLDSDNYFIPNKQKPTMAHDVSAINTYNDFQIGFYCFRREKDGSIITREYYANWDKMKKIPMVMEKSSTPELTSLEFDSIPKAYNGVSLRTCSLELIYSIKENAGRKKDRKDLAKLEPYINKQKALLLECLDRNRDINIIDIYGNSKSLKK